MKVYYAHCMTIYGTVQEHRDVRTLEGLGHEVVNPANLQERYREWIDSFPEYVQNHTLDKMEFWLDEVKKCDALAFRAIPGGPIPAGVFKEILAAEKLRVPVIELPSSMARRRMSVDETIEYLRESGQR